MINVKAWVIITLIAWFVPALGQDKEEQVALSAIKKGEFDVLKSYLEKHPGPLEEFSDGKTSLFYAIKYDQPRIARLLIEYGADVNKPDKKQNTPLIFAAELNNLQLCKILIDRGANPLHQNSNEKTASDYAYYYTDSPVYKYLVMMENLYMGQDTVPSMNDGPYFFWETDNLLVMTYYEHNQEQHLTRLVEKTIETGNNDVVARGIGRDTISYHIKHSYSPDPFNVISTGNVFVIGDLHGKYNALVNLLMNNKIIDSSLNWTFGNGQLVLLGDIFDRGSMVTETLWFLYELEFKAQQAGGNVNLLLGNHEIMALDGDHRYLNPKYDYFARYMRTDYFLLFERNTVLGKWLRSKNIIVRINDCLLMHAGISPEFASYNYTYEEINKTVRDYLNSDEQVEKSSPVHNILGAIGPLWYRGYFSDNADTGDTSDDNYFVNENKVLPRVSQDFVDNYLNSNGLKRMIVGHNEQDTINSSFQGKVISADVAIDEMGKTAQALLIAGDKLYICFADGTRKEIK